MNTTKSKIAWRRFISSMVLTVAIAGAVVLENPKRTLLAASTQANRVKAPESKKHVVSIQRYKFVPEVLTIAAGDTVEWTNDDDVPHTATSIQKGFDSGNLPTGGTWEFGATQSGEFLYYCTYHPAMKAKLIVK